MLRAEEHYHHCHSSIFCGIHGLLRGGGGSDPQKVRARRDWDSATCHPQKPSFPEAEGLLPPFSASVSPAADLSPSLFFSGLTLGHNITEAQWLAQDLPKTTKTQWLALEPEPSAGSVPLIPSTKVLSTTGSNSLHFYSTHTAIGDCRGRNNKQIWRGRHSLVM